MLGTKHPNEQIIIFVSWMTKMKLWRLSFESIRIGKQRQQKLIPQLYWLLFFCFASSSGSRLTRNYFLRETEWGNTASTSGPIRLLPWRDVTHRTHISLAKHPWSNPVSVGRGNIVLPLHKERSGNEWPERQSPINITI